MAENKIAFCNNTASNPAPQKQQITSQSRKLGGIEIPQNFTASSAAAAKTMVQTSFVRAFRAVMAINAGLCLLAALIAALTIKNPTSSRYPASG